MSSNVGKATVSCPHKGKGSDKTTKTTETNERNKVDRSKCSTTGHPVDIATGKVLTEHTDFGLSGPIPIEWGRVYFSTSIYNGPLGYSWHHNYDLVIYQNDDEMIIVRLADGRLVEFPMLEPGEKHFNRKEQLTLISDQKGFVLRNQSGLFYRFTKLDPKDDIYHLIALENRNNQKISFKYNAKKQLIQIIDSAGRSLFVTNDNRGRIQEIYGPHPDIAGQDIKLVSYDYDIHGNLIAVRDASDQPFTYDYQNHLLVKETNRNGLSFYFEYDGADENARCLHTWGDEGIYDHKLTYFPKEQFTIVENSLGHKTHHYYTDEGVVTAVMDALGNNSRTIYNEYNEVTSEIDELGRVTQYNYDDRGNQTSIIQPDNAIISLEFDEEDQLISATDAVGGKWQWIYDEKGNLIKRFDPLERQTEYSYQKGLLTEVTDPAGNQTRLKYDKQNNLTELVTVDNAVSHWEYDLSGRCIAITDPKGNVQYRKFDDLGRILKIDEPDGNQRYLKYDGEGNVIQARDRQHNVRFSYQGMNRLASRTEAGTIVEFHYDTEDQLIGIKNEHGFAYRFELDPLGNVAEEIGFDELKRIYERDAAGQVIQVQRPEERLTQYVYDPAGRVTQVLYDDETEEKYNYREDGELVLAENQHQNLEFERNLIGQVTKEIQGDFEVISSYDMLGRRIKVSSSLGADIDISRNEMGDVERLGAKQGENQTWKAAFKHDILGLEIERSLPGGIKSHIKRDKVGRPIHHQISGGKVNFMDKRYEWDVNDRLRKIIDAHHGTTTFSHDELGNLASAQYGDGTFEFRMPDAVGNLFKTKNQGDRKYGPAGQLLEAKGTRYRYDAEGNLIQKLEPNGKTWYYQWNASGMMSKVIRSDGTEVTFTYDALGRRLSKTYRGKTTKWVWDDNLPLHEWIELETKSQTENTLDISQQGNDNKTKELLSTAPAHGPPSDLTTWIFEPESFAPVAKLKNGEQFSIVSNYLGTPSRMFDSLGKQVWATDTSIYGKLRNLEGETNACPFRYPGQYEDEETGLYYNRFRYYNPESGEYLSQDPIGLLGNNPNFYAYVFDSNSWTDPLGLDPFGPNQDVYALYNKTDVVNGVPIEGAKPYYVGISQNSDVRLGQHTGKGRFNPATDVKVDLHKDIDYAKARAYEQHYIEKYETIDKTNPKANQQNSFRHNRTDARGQAFEAEYKNIKCN